MSPAAAKALALAGPARRMRRPAVAVMLVGAPGVGKTTFAWRLREATGAAVIESDAVRRALFRRPRYDRQESAAVFDAVHQALRELLARGASVIVDATNLIEAERSAMYRIADEAGAPLMIVRLTAPAAVVRRRLEGGTARGASAAGVEEFERMRRRRQPVTRRHYVVDTTRGTGAAVEAVAREMRGR